MDTLTIEQLATHCYLGIYEWEQQVQQKILVSYRLSITPQDYQERIDETLNYASIAEAIHSFCQDSHFQLLETLTHQLADHLECHFPCNNLQQETC